MLIDPGGIQFDQTRADGFRLFRDSCSEALRYLESQLPAETTDERFVCTADRTRRRPLEQVRYLRKATDFPARQETRWRVTFMTHHTAAWRRPEENLHA